MVSTDSSDDIDLETVFEVIDEVEEKVTDEDMTGTFPREKIAEGTCQRIRRRLRETVEE